MMKALILALLLLLTGCSSTAAPKESVSAPSDPPVSSAASPEVSQSVICLTADQLRERLSAVSAPELFAQDGWTQDGDILHYQQPDDSYLSPELTAQTEDSGIRSVELVLSCELLNGAYAERFNAQAQALLLAFYPEQTPENAEQLCRQLYQQADSESGGTYQADGIALVSFYRSGCVVFRWNAAEE